MVETNLEKGDVLKDLKKAFKDKQLDALELLADWIDEVKDAIETSKGELEEDTLHNLRGHRHLQDGTVVEKM